MTILSAMQSAAIRLVGRKPTQFFGSTDQFELEITDLIQEAAVDIMKKADWQALLVFEEQAGDGSTIAFDLPSDFDHMTMNGKVHAIAWENGQYTHAEDLAQWIDVTDTFTTGSPGYWIVIANQLNVYPAMPASEQARYYYISNKIALDTDGTTTKAAFDADTDTFRIDERLLTLALVWRWRHQKRMEYAEDFENYEQALSEAVGRQKGSRQIIALGGPRLNAIPPYPGTISPS